MVSLSRYLLRQHLAPFALAFCLIVFVLVIDVVLQMLDQVLGKGLAAGMAAQLFLYNLAWIVALAAPMAVLVAVLMAFGRLAADNEILALKASGVSFGSLLAAPLAAAGLLAVLMVLFNDRVLPDWNHEARELGSDLKRRKAALVLKQKEGVFIRDLGPYSLLVRRVDEEANRLFGITLYDTSQPGAPTTLRAASGQIEIHGDGSYTRLVLEGGEYHRVDDDDPGRLTRGTFARQVVHIRDADRDFPAYRSSYRSDREMDVAAMLAAVAESRREDRLARAAMDSAAQAFVAEAAAADSGQVRQLRQRADLLKGRFDKEWRLSQSRQRRANSYLVEVHKKFSIAVACVVFVLVGAPVGAAARARGAAVSVALSLAFFFAYWMFLIGGEELADRGFVSPAAAMWAPNVVFGLLGLLLTRAAVLDLPLSGLETRRPRPRRDR